VQEELIRRIAATGKPFAVVVLAGRPLVLSGIVEHAPAVLAGWHPGLEGGNAVADVLFGEVNPGGKLPVTFPRAVGQLAEYYAHENTGRPYDPDNKYTSKYLDLAHGPLFPFGHGLSYTTFRCSRLELSEKSVSAKAVRTGHAKVGVTVRVENTGRRKGDEVVQLYVRDRVASIAQPVRRLRGFERVALEPGESRTVSFELGADDLGFHTNDPSGELLVEAGEFTLYAGGSSEAELHTTLTLI
jgi:beta-glucosidase